MECCRLAQKRLRDRPERRSRVTAHCKVAFARAALQAGAIQNGDLPLAVPDQARALELAGCFRHARPAHAQHDREIPVGQRQFVALNSIANHQEPASEPLGHGMATVTNGDPANLIIQDLRVPHQDRPEAGVSLYLKLQERRLYPQAAPGDLDPGDRRRRVVSESSGKADRTFSADHPDFDARSVAERRNAGTDTRFRKIDELDRLARVPESLVSLQRDRLEMGGQPASFFRREGCKEVVLDSGLGGAEAVWINPLQH